LNCDLDSTGKRSPTGSPNLPGGGLLAADVLTYSPIEIMLSIRYIEPSFLRGSSMTIQIKKKLEDEIRVIEYELKNDLPQELKRARALGDLSENAEYQSAKQRQEILNAKLAHLRKRLAEVAMINFDKIPKDRASYGSTVVLYDIQKSAEITYKLVSVEESDLQKGLISTTSPIGKGLLNRQEGDTVKIATPGGLKEFEILKLTTIHDQPESTVE
jgi:transcription elongation factor GreA